MRWWIGGWWIRGGVGSIEGCGDGMGDMGFVGDEVWM